MLAWSCEPPDKNNRRSQAAGRLGVILFSSAPTCDEIRDPWRVFIRKVVHGQQIHWLAKDRRRRTVRQEARGTPLATRKRLGSLLVSGSGDLLSSGTPSLEVIYYAAKWLYRHNGVVTPLRTRLPLAVKAHENGNHPESDTTPFVLRLIISGLEKNRREN